MGLGGWEAGLRAAKTARKPLADQGGLTEVARTGHKRDLASVLPTNGTCPGATGRPSAGQVGSQFNGRNRPVASARAYI